MTTERSEVGNIRAFTSAIQEYLRGHKTAWWEWALWGLGRVMLIVIAIAASPLWIPILAILYALYAKEEMKDG